MDTASFQRDVNALLPGDYEAFRAAGPDMSAKAREAAFAAHPALRRYDEAFDRVFDEVARTRVVRRPAVWLLYNMGVVVKTPKTVFAIDLVHRRAVRFAPVLDFALVTHNHADHADAPLLDAMDAAGKTVVSNFRDNYPAFGAGRTCGSSIPAANSTSPRPPRSSAPLSPRSPTCANSATPATAGAGRPE